MAHRWEASRYMMLSADGASVTHSRDGADGTVGGLLMTEGKHTLHLQIVASERNRGFLYLGVVAANRRTAGWPSRPAHPGDTSLAWGF
eukprot:3266554-Prymnesium_polylepis.1